MVLGVTISAWDGIELLRGAMECVRGHVDHFVIVYQRKSNHGEVYDPMADIEQAIQGFNNVHLIEYIPTMFKRESTGRRNEKQKRKIGIDKVKQLGCSHFFAMDVDEYYENFGEAKQVYIDSNHHGSVCKMWTYFKKPIWRLENPENYFVPFIHRLTHNTTVGPEYPFYVDRTRRVNQMDVVELPIMMHHFSWVRKDIARKCRNSSARNLIQFIGEYENAEAGKTLNMYDQKLIEVENIFNIEI